MSRIDDPAVLEAIENAFTSASSVLNAALPANVDVGKDIRTELKRRLAALAAQGITNPQELRRKALVMALDP